MSCKPVFIFLGYTRLAPARQVSFGSPPSLFLVPMGLGNLARSGCATPLEKQKQAYDI